MIELRRLKFETLDEAAQEASRLLEIGYVRSGNWSLGHTAPFAPHPAFGRVPRQTILQIHAAHAAHHLRFLQAQ